MSVRPQRKTEKMIISNVRVLKQSRRKYEERIDGEIVLCHFSGSINSVPFRSFCSVLGFFGAVSVFTHAPIG